MEELVQKILDEEVDPNDAVKEVSVEDNADGSAEDEQGSVGEQADDLSDDEEKSWDVVQDLSETDFQGSNESQNKGVQLLKGLANADNDVADAFMDRLSDAYTDVAQDVADEFNLEM